MDYMEWLEQRDPPVPGRAKVLHRVSDLKKGQALTVGIQPGAMSSKYATAPLIVASDYEEHFDLAKMLAASRKTPWIAGVTSEDLEFSIWYTTKYRNSIKEKREECRKSICELSRRCMSITRELRRFQPDHIRSIAGLKGGLVRVWVSWPGPISLK